jgi:hypothetical protein
MSARAAFWVVVVGILTHAGPLGFGILAVVYFACTTFDHWQINRTTKRVIHAIDDEIDWKRDPNDPETESKGELTRVRLPNKEQIVVHRVYRLLREIEIARLIDIP